VLLSGTEYAPDPNYAWLFIPATVQYHAANESISSMAGRCAPDKSPPVQCQRRSADGSALMGLVWWAQEGGDFGIR